MTSHGVRIPLILAIASVLILGPAGCASTQPRDHWWQFWRPKQVASTSIFHPDRVIVPPPPNMLAPATADGSELGPDGEMVDPPDPLEELSLRPEPEPLRVEPAGMVSQLRTVHFEFDSDIIDAAAMAILDENARWIMANPGLQVLIEGHCDGRGTNEYNFALGDRRGKKVKAYLVQQGVSDEVLHTISYGEERPVDPNLDDVAFGANRRAQFLVY